MNKRGLSASLGEGRVYAWGHARALGTKANHFSAVLVPYLGVETAKIVKVACGAEHSVALSADGVVYTFGSNTSEQLGITEVDIATALRGFSLEPTDVPFSYFRHFKNMDDDSASPLAPCRDNSRDPLPPS